MNFDPFYQTLNLIVSEINKVSASTQNSVQGYINKKSAEAQKAVTDFSTENLKDLDFNVDVQIPLDLNTDILGSNSLSTDLEYEVAAVKLKKDLAYLDSKVDDAQIKQKIQTIRSVVNQNIQITPETKKLVAVQNQIQAIISAKQKEIK